MDRLQKWIGQKATNRSNPGQGLEGFDVWSTGLGDKEVIERARNAKNGDNFCRLFEEGNLSDYDEDDSRADMALVRLIAFWTGPCPEQIERIFSGSTLGLRDKWQDREDYRERTILNVLADMAADSFFSGSTRDGLSSFPGIIADGQSVKSIDATHEIEWACDSSTIIQDFQDDFASGGHGKAWLPLVPLETEVQVEPFPVDVLPCLLAGYAKEASRVIGCPLDYIGGSMLAVAGAALGSSRKLSLKGTSYLELSNLWVCLVGRPGSSKSPAMSEVIRPLEEIGNEEYAKSKAEGTAIRQAWVADVTTEAMALVLGDNPTGVLLHRDELVGWVRSMDQYKGKGSDRQFYLAVWSRKGLHYQRKGDYKNGPLIVQSPFLSVLGGLPTEQLHQLISKETDGDGFLDRMLFVYPKDVPVTDWSSEEISAAIREGWDKAVRDLWSVPANPQQTVLFSSAAETRWKELYNQHADEMNDKALPPHLGNVWSKLRAYAGRLTLVLHMLHHGKDGAEVGVESVEGAWRLVNYFKSQARRAYGVMNADLDVKQAARILGWIRKRNGIPFTRSEAYSSLKNKSVSKPSDLSQPLQLLVSYGYIRRVVSGPQRGRPAERYEVNPSILQ